MQLYWIWSTVLIVIVGTLLLRLAGRNSIAKMTVTELVIMITIGPLLSRPIENQGLWTTFGVASVLIFTLFAIQLLKITFVGVETFLTGKPVLVIENGTINEENMKKIKLTTENLEMRLNQAGIDAIGDLEWATIEVSGELGYKLKSDKQPATKQDIQNLLQLIETKFSDS
ncbi:DUF421 domain-containing protein [Bacillus sp. sid0103]|uniref:DUF421 domain-containing protein n=1 Tax=Bacillus sp. sid0103 TaxID=2856337 RepID=UPI001C44FF56|nr:YetF domain-containing protein [Bacillus sp. sid0103]MBV7505535.1 DUF421 domain-containing protein [Bacillus sp. sid0103]